MKNFLNNWELKLLALLCAIVLWFFVVGIENNSYLFPEGIDVHAINLPTGMSVSNDLGKASIRINAAQDMIKNLTKSDFDLSVNLQNAHAGAQDLPISATSKNDKVTILKVDPAIVHVILEPVTGKDIQIKSVITGNPATGYSVKDVTITPQTVTISGGKSLLSNLNSLNAEIKLDGSESTNFKQNITLKLPDMISSLKNVTIDPQQVMVEVTIMQDLQQKTVVIKPDLKGSIDLGVLSKKLVVTPQILVIQGKEDLLNKIDSITTEPVSLDTLKDATYPMKAKLILPKGVTLLDGQSNSILISLTAT